MTLLTDDEYARLSPAGKRRYVQLLIRGANEVFAESYEQSLTPKVPFKTAEHRTRTTRRHGITRSPVLYREPGRR
jgi:hypothetical protein